MKNFFLILGLAIAPSPAYAYIGPGAGMGAIAVLVAIIIGFLLLAAGFIWYPLKRLLKKSKQSLDYRQEAEKTMKSARSDEDQRKK